MVSSPVDHYYRYRERTINLLSLGTTIASLARQRRRWEPLLRSMPRTQSLARDFDPAFDHLTEVTGFGSNPGALRMFEYVPADPQPALGVALHGCMQKAASYDFGAGCGSAGTYSNMRSAPGLEPNPVTSVRWSNAGSKSRASDCVRGIERNRGPHRRRCRARLAMVVPRLSKLIVLSRYR